MPSSLLTLAAVSVLLMVACGSASRPQSPAATPAAGTSDYVTIVPDESTYPARTPIEEPEPIGENEDVMASILAIPPGR